MSHARLKLHQVTRGSLCTTALCLCRQRAHFAQSLRVSEREGLTYNCGACLARAGGRASERIKANSSANRALWHSDPTLPLITNTIYRIMPSPSYKQGRVWFCYGARARVRGPDPCFKLVGAGRALVRNARCSLANPQPIGFNFVHLRAPIVEEYLQIGFGTLQRWTDPRIFHFIA